MKTLIQDYRDDKKHRLSFFRFIEEVFPGMDFKTWYDEGCWTDAYIPYSFIENGRIIANVSISKMDLWIDGKQKKGLQVGTVGTVPDYRNRGLSRELMEHVLHIYQEVYDIFFLYANDTVTGFYPKFGFKNMTETVYELNSPPLLSSKKPTKLNLHNPGDNRLIKSMLSKRKILTKRFGAQNYDSISYWHCINSFPDNMHLLEDENMIIIMSQNEKRLDIWDAICLQEPVWTAIIPKLCVTDSIRFLRFHFPPDVYPFDYDHKDNVNELLFIRGKFPLEEGSFRFPVTAQT